MTTQIKIIQKFYDILEFDEFENYSKLLEFIFDEKNIVNLSEINKNKIDLYNLALKGNLQWFEFWLNVINTESKTNCNIIYYDYITLLIKYFDDNNLKHSINDFNNKESVINLFNKLKI